MAQIVYNAWHAWFKGCGKNVATLDLLSDFSVIFLGLWLVPTIADVVALVGTDYTTLHSSLCAPDALPKKISLDSEFRQFLPSTAIYKDVPIEISDSPLDIQIIGAPATTGLSSFAANITLARSVTGFSVDDITDTNGTVPSLTGRRVSYRAPISPNGLGDVALSIPPNGASGTDAIHAAKDEDIATHDNAETGPDYFYTQGTRQGIATTATEFGYALDRVPLYGSTTSGFIGQTSVTYFTAPAPQNSTDPFIETLTFAEAVK
ncbi:hypothetical protein [Pseudovibrio sp. Tun.PSC04-5.I4]|uniref:hypothetical protein n=1 Tax=Pseudovibrio sp. Tun.PSC04-5.I4 TaxID=1798213 RepID=UPI00089250D7|nr:hypothetical protein [Pseudovibrio sp. Tun.PSC04-5.I4]SDR09487.1 hypothetical protein SAMN04515695_2731 [Pseudovibrio sp. Tun.PSC04-5.I4]